MYKQTVLYVLLILAIIGHFGPMEAQQLGRTDPVAVANTFLKNLKTKDYPAILSIMPEEQRKEYSMILKNNPKDIERIFSKDRKKAGKIMQVSELRKMTTFSGKPGIAAKVKKKGREVFVIILSKEGEEYCYENSLSLTAKLYKELTFIQKVKYETP